jgi:hypothetical protein
MKNVGGACLKLLVLYLVLVAGVAVVAWYRTADTGFATLAGFIGAVPLWLAVAYLISIPGRIRDWILIRRAARGAPEQDGKRTAVLGTLRALRETLRAPFSDTPCVAYTYAVDTIGEDTPGGSFNGSAMAPAAVHTRFGDFRLLAMPDFEEHPRLLTGSDVMSKAKRFFEATEFTQGTRVFNAPLDTHGGYRHDRAIGTSAPNFERSAYKELVFAPGEPVCVIGAYDSARRGLVPDPKAAFLGLVLKRGTEQSIASRAARAPFTALIGAAFFTAIFAVAALWTLAAMPLDAAEQVNASRVIWWPEVRLERWLERDVRPRMVSMLGTPGTRLPELCAGCARGRIEILGEVIPLTTAVGRENAEQMVLEVRGEGATIVRTWDKKTRTPALAIERNGRTFVVPPDWLSPEDVQTFGGSENEVEGRITIVAPDDSIRCRVYFSVRLQA